jgi:hypothetical protein
VRVLLDECVPRKLRRELPGRDALLRLAAAKVDVFLTVDQGIPYQQDLPGLDVALVIVRAPSNDISDLRPRMPEVTRVLDTIQPGQVMHLGA